MKTNHSIPNQSMEVLKSLPAYTQVPVPIYTVVSVAPSNGRRTAFLTGMALAMGLAATVALGWVITEATHRQNTLREALAQAQVLHAEEQRNLQSLVTQLEQARVERQQAIEGLAAERALLAQALASSTPVAEPVRKSRSRSALAPQDNAPKPAEAPSSAEVAEAGSGPIVAEAAPVPDPESPLAKAMDATQQLVATEVSEPPTLETIKAHIKAGDPLVATNKEAARAERSPVMKILTHPIFIDSAVLGTSLLVPPSLPLTLAQSRLGRGLTNRAMKKADLDKTAVGHVAKDVGNMPVTRKRSKNR